ncbi:MAG: hypothetical protein ABFD82_07035 [Syntrophaceae bacterium]
MECKRRIYRLFMVFAVLTTVVAILDLNPSTLCFRIKKLSLRHLGKALYPQQSTLNILRISNILRNVLHFSPSKKNLHTEINKKY